MVKILILIYFKRAYLIYQKKVTQRLVKHKSELAELEQKSNNLDDYIRHEKDNGATRDEVILMQAHKPLIRQYIRKIKVDLRRLENKLNRVNKVHQNDTGIYIT